MNITGYVVSVDYAPLLELGIEKWKASLDEMVVVTSPHDKETIRLCL